MCVSVSTTECNMHINIAHSLGKGYSRPENLIDCQRAAFGKLCSKIQDLLRSTCTMDITFVINNKPETAEFNVDKKTGAVFKSYRARTVKFEIDTLKCYSENALKDDELLLGAQVYAAPGSLEIKIKLKDRKDMVSYRLKNNTDVTLFLDAVRRTIRTANVLGIQNGSRDPEVVEWYFQYQADMVKKTSFIQEKHTVHMYHTLPGQEVGRKSVFDVTMPTDRSGLLFTLNTFASDEAPSRFASLYNGRIVSFADINGAFIPSGSFDPAAATNDKVDASFSTKSSPNAAPFAFVLHTKEDELSLEMDHNGAKWLQAVQALCIFATMPAPSSRAVSPPGSPISSTSGDVAGLGFSKNSGAVFAVSSEVALMLQSLSSRPAQSRTMALFVEEVHAVFRGLGEVRCNRDAAIVFGERIEDIIRLLSDREITAACNTPEKGEVLEPKIGALTVALQSARAYIKTQRHAGWLKYNVEASSTPKFMFDTLDANLMSIVNTLIGALGLGSGLMFEKKEYVGAVNVRASVESLGGLDKIFNDSIKERSLAQLVQADGAEVRRELERLNGMMFATSVSSFSTSATAEDDANKAATSWWCCGWCCPTSGAKPKKTVRAAHASLKEPLVNESE